MSGHLFILGQRQITETVVKNKRIQVSAKQCEAGAGEIKADDLIFCGVGRKGGPITLWLTAKAATNYVKDGGYIRLSFVKAKDSNSAYALVEGIGTGQTLKDVGWKKLDDREAMACFFDTTLYSRLVSDSKSNLSFKSKLSRTLPYGLGLDSETVFQSVLLNGSSNNQGPILRSRYDTEILISEAIYKDVLMQRLTELDGRVFEELLREFFKHSAFQFDDIRTTSKSYDAGIDLILTRHDDLCGSMLIVGQCKRQHSTISPKDVQALATVRNQARAAKANFITTAKFSPNAQEVAAQDGHIELIDGDKLAKLFFQNAEKVPGIWGLIRQSVQLTMGSRPSSYGRSKAGADKSTELRSKKK